MQEGGTTSAAIARMEAVGSPVRTVLFFLANTILGAAAAQPVALRVARDRLEAVEPEARHARARGGESRRVD